MRPSPRHCFSKPRARRKIDRLTGRFAFAFPPLKAEDDSLGPGPSAKNTRTGLRTPNYYPSSRVLAGLFTRSRSPQTRPVDNIGIRTVRLQSGFALSCSIAAPVTPRANIPFGNLGDNSYIRSFPDADKRSKTWGNRSKLFRIMTGEYTFTDKHWRDFYNLRPRD